MKRNARVLNYICCGGIVFAASNFYVLCQGMAATVLLLAVYFMVNIMPVLILPKTKRLKACARGNALLIEFLISTALSVSLFFWSLVNVPDWKIILANTLIAIVLEAIVFWNGIIRVYLRSLQLGIKIRVIGVVCGLIPVAQLVALGMIIQTVSREIAYENRRILLDEERTDLQICATKYPVLMVHGVFFRDFRYLNYWGRIPDALQKNGAKIFYGNHQSAASIDQSGQEIAERILQIVRETGCEKVNIIAHSKGGLDCRSALSNPGIAKHVATLTTVNTPHRGCEFADYLLSKVPKAEQDVVAVAYNAAMKRLGDPNPDFMAAVTNLTASYCKAFNERIMDAQGVYYQSIGSKLNKASGGRFPMNFTYYLAHYFDGANDGLVGEDSFPWGADYRLLTVNGKRGISHGDMIDLNRQNIEEFDVREFYVQLVADLKKRGF